MAGISQIQNYWEVVSEIDLRPLEREATQGVKIAVVGASSALCAALADEMRNDPARPEMVTDTPVLLANLESGLYLDADVFILMLDSQQADFTNEKNLAHQLADAGRRVLVFQDLLEKPPKGQAIIPSLPWRPRYFVYGPVNDSAFLHEQFVPVMIRLLPDKLLALGRDFPLFRVPIARHLIADTCQSNAAYSLATGMGELVPILNIPLVVTDMVVLTKNQAFLIYKLGLVFGFSTQWKHYAAEFGSVLGVGFIWRQIARSLVGLIPGWGIIPKVAIAYAGTAVVGNAILQWYLNDRHVTRAQIKASFNQAIIEGQTVAKKLVSRRSERKMLEAPALPAGEPGVKPARAKRRKKQTCPYCKRQSAADASFCQYCGTNFVQPPSLDPAHPSD